MRRDLGMRVKTSEAYAVVCRVWIRLRVLVIIVERKV